MKFTKENETRLKELANNMLFKNETIMPVIGSPLSIQDLLFCTTIGTLQQLKQRFQKEIAKIEEGDEWVEVNTDKLAQFEEKKELLHLIIGWKHFNSEKAQKERECAALEAEIASIKEAQETPEDKMKKLQEKLDSLRAQ